MEQDEELLIQKLMSMLGSGRELKFKSPTGQTIKVSLDGSSNNDTEPSNEHTPPPPEDPDDDPPHHPLFPPEPPQHPHHDTMGEELNEINEDFNALSQHKEQVRPQEGELSLQGFEQFEMEGLRQLAIHNHSNSSKNEDNIFSELMEGRKEEKEKPKKVTLSHRLKKEANEPVLSFFKEEAKTEEIKTDTLFSEFSIPLSIASSPVISRVRDAQRGQAKSQTVKEGIAMLRENHPEDTETIELINRRLLQLQAVEKRVDESLSLINSSISNSLKLDSFDVSLLSFNQPNSQDPLCYIFAQFLSKAKEARQQPLPSLPSFLFMYSQPLLHQSDRSTVPPLEYFQEETTIQKLLKEGKCRVDYSREPATIPKFHAWIKQGVEILHFCGHGVKAEENYLLFENQVGEAVNVTAEKLTELLSEQKRPLKLVVVASCHSQTAGRVFAEAGATHVICIRDDYRILDQACLDFVKLFYLTCINGQTTICEAFDFAKKQLALKDKYSQHECQKFMLISSHSRQQCREHFTPRTGLTGFNDLCPRPRYNKNLPSRVEHYIPRSIELHQILVLLEQRRRFVTIIGQSGMGKSTLARELVRYIQFRNYFKDGVVYLELSRCEGMAKIYEVLDLQLFETPQLRLNKTPGENANRLVKELGEQSVLLVLDNCHSIMQSQERESFKRLVEILMRSCPNLYFLFTSRHSIGRQIDYCSEVLFELGRLTDAQAQQLFFEKVAREIQKKELDDFYALEKNLKEPRKHSFFEFLNGHPEAICLTASLLSYRSLSELYVMLLQPNMSEEFHEGAEEKYGQGMNRVVETAMKISLNVIHHKYKAASEMIKVLSLLPNGLDVEMMTKVFQNDGKWKETVRKLMNHSLVQCIEKTNCRYYLVHPTVIVDVENEITHEEKVKFHQRICEELVKRLEKIYRHVGTLSQFSQRAQELFLLDQDNYKAIFLREMSFVGDKYPLRKFYEDLFRAGGNEEEEGEREKPLSDAQLLAIIEANKKRRSSQQADRNQLKKEAMDVIIVYFVTILFVVRKVKNSPIETYLHYGLMIGLKRKKELIVSNLLRIKGCIYLAQGKDADAKLFFQTARIEFAHLGCGLGSACCQAAMGYIKFFCEQEYASAKMNLQNALKYYDQIPHPFGKHYLNRWLCSLKSKMNRGERELISHKLEAQKLLKEAKSNLRSNNIHNTSLIKHKFGFFVFRFLFDNISLFLEAAFETDLRPKFITFGNFKPEKAAKNNVLDDINEEMPVLPVTTKRNFNVKATEKPEKEKMEKEKVEKGGKSNMIEEEETATAAPLAKKAVVNVKKVQKQQ